MGALLIVILVSGLFHYIYQSTILPTLRIKSRHKLFALRDRLRRNEQYGEQEAFKILDETISAAINRLDYTGLSFAIHVFKAFEKNQEWQKVSQQRRNIIENSENDTIKNVIQSVKLEIGKNLLLNIGGWNIYLLPIPLMLLFIMLVRNSVKNIIELMLDTLSNAFKGTYIPEKMLNNTV